LLIYFLYWVLCLAFSHDIDFKVKYDLHSHSRCSDGILSPSELVSRASDKQVDVLALTDHDTTAGIAEARRAAADKNITVIAGVEFSCQWLGRGIHVVGLGLDLDNKDLQRAEKLQSAKREERCELIAAKLTKLGILGSLEGARALANGVSVGRPHFAQYLVDRGHVSSIKQAFKKYLGSGKAGDVKALWPELGEVIAWVNAAGGQAVIAHPDKYKLTRTKLRQLADCFAGEGGAAMELVSGRQAPGLAANLAVVAKEYGLLGSCGSDFHRPEQPWQELGNFEALPSGVEPVWRDWA